MKKVNIILVVLISILLIFVVAFIITFNYYQTSLTAAVIQPIEPKNKYTYTKAICFKDTYCIDYEITCDGTTLIETKQVSKLVEFRNYKIPEDTKEELCS